jgi:hypothetical protein
MAHTAEALQIRRVESEEIGIFRRLNDKRVFQINQLSPPCPAKFWGRTTFIVAIATLKSILTPENTS